MARRRNGSGLPTDSLEAREHFLNAAEACFGRYGVAKTTMDDIAQEAGVSRPTVYRHFSDRDSLILAVIMRRSQQLIGKAQAYIRKYETFEEQLVEGLLFLVDTGRKDTYIRYIVSPESMGLANQLFATSTAATDLTHEMWAPILAAAVERGELRDDLDFKDIAVWLTHLELILFGRLDVVPDVDALRAMIRTFVPPAFSPLAKAALSPA